MGNIFDPFLSTGRFEVAFAFSEPRYCLSLRITNLTAEDSGNYTCEVRGRKSVVLSSVTHYIFVRAPIRQLLLTSDEETNSDSPRHSPPDSGDFEAGTANITLDSSTTTERPFQLAPPRPSRITFIDSVPRPVRCTSLGGYPAPSVFVYLNDRDVSGQLGLTATTELRPGGVRGLRSLSTQVERGGVGDWRQRGTIGSAPHGGSGQVGTGGAVFGGLLTLRPDDDGAKLRCVATVPGMAPNITEIVVDVHYGPIIECDQRAASLDERDVTLRCQVRAKPGLTSLFWVIDVNGTMLSGGEVINEYWSVVRERSDVGVMETQLHMRRASRDSFRVYHVIAENAIAARTHHTRLLPRTQVPVTPAARGRLPVVNTTSRGRTALSGGSHSSSAGVRPVDRPSSRTRAVNPHSSAAVSSLLDTDPVGRRLQWTVVGLVCWVFVAARHPNRAPVAVH